MTTFGDFAEERARLEQERDALAESHAELMAALAWALYKMDAAHEIWKAGGSGTVTVGEPDLAKARAALTRARALKGQPARVPAPSSSPVGT